MFGAVCLFLQMAEYAGGGRSTFSHHLGPKISQQEERFARSPELQRLLLWVLEADQPLFVDPQKAIQTCYDHYYQKNGHSVLVPIPGSIGAAGGVLLLLGSPTIRPFDENDLIVIRTIANSASVAIGNCNLDRSPGLIPA